MTTPTPSPAPTGLEATQQRRPWRATLRTILQVGVPALLGLPLVFEILVEELGGTLPPQVTGYLVAAGAFVTAIAAVLARLMAIPGVELFLRRLPAAAFAAQPRPKPTDPGDRGRADASAVVAIAAVVFIVVVLLWALGVVR
jgi:hypothetical protein